MCDIFLQGCHGKCTVGCTSYCVLATVGYKFGELSNVTINAYQADGTFSRLVSSTVVQRIDSVSGHTSWNNANYPNDTTGDTLNCVPLQLVTAFDFDQAKYDIEIVIPSAGKSYRFTQINFTGPENVKEQCTSNGKQLPSGCSRYISSYAVNGSVITFGPNNSTLFVHK